MNIHVWKHTKHDLMVQVDVDSSKGRDIFELCGGKLWSIKYYPNGRRMWTLEIAPDGVTKAKEILVKLKEEGVDIDT